MSFVKRRYHEPGTSPGTFDTPQTRETALPELRIIDLSAKGRIEHQRLEALDQPPQGEVRWIQVFGRPNLELLRKLQEQLNLDPLALEDVVNLGQRPKFNDLDNHLFITLSIPDLDDEARFRQLSLCLAGDVLVSFYEGPPDIFDPVGQRLDRSAAMRERGAAYLAYTLVDLAVDHMFPWLEVKGDRLDELEDQILDRPDAGLLRDVHSQRRMLLVFRRIAWATRAVIGDLLRHFESSDAGRVQVYLEDAQDHILTIIDISEVLRDVATTLVELYMSNVSNRMNDVMKVLTVIATLFIPPTFIAGVYGMNFDRTVGPLSMPELGWPFGYLAVLGFMLLLMGGMLAYFKRRNWF